MKRLLSLILFSICLLTLNPAEASLYPDYLGGSRNFILCGGHMGVGVYVDKSSVTVKQKDDRSALLKVKILYVDDADKGKTSGKIRTMYFAYLLDKRAAYRYIESNKSWGYIKPIGTTADRGWEFSYEMAYYIAFHERFYGGVLWWDDYFGDYIDAFDDDFYLPAYRLF